jgi:hypothetical protein
MSREPTAFELCLPGIVAGLMLATVVLATGEAVFPHAFQEISPHQAFEVLLVVVCLATGLGLMSLFSHSRAQEEKSRQYIPSIDSKKEKYFSVRRNRCSLESRDS